METILEMDERRKKDLLHKFNLNMKYIVENNISSKKARYCKNKLQENLGILDELSELITQADYDALYNRMVIYLISHRM